jgi:flagellar biosynthesis protein FlhG
MPDDLEPPPSSFEEEDDDAGAAPRAGRRLIAVGGGRGGVGKSVVAESLAVYFAQLGKPVILVDADPTGANLHSHFGLAAGTKEPSLEGSGADSEDPLISWTDALQPTAVPGLRLLPAAHDTTEPPVALRASRKARWLSRLRALPAEYLVVDAGPGHGPFAVDLLLAADLAIVVTVPEPPAIETTYRFIRAAFVRRVRRTLTSDRFRLGLFERALMQLGVLPAPIDLVRMLSKMDKELAVLAWNEASRLRLHLVVNQTRVRADLDLGHQMSDLAARHYGVVLDELGHIEHDDTVWLAVRRNRPLLIDSPASKAARNVERIARRVLALSTARAERGVVPTPIPELQPTLYAALGVTRSSNDEEIRRAYKRVKEMYAPQSLATSSLRSEAELRTDRMRLDEAYDTLLDPLRRRAYDLSTFSEAEVAAAPAASPKPAMLAEQAMLQHELAGEIGPDTEFTGALLRKVREAYGIELKEICERTKIGKAYLVAIEEEDFASLPSAVYVRGFVAEVAKFLKLDPPQVQRTYLRRMKEHQTTRGNAREEP